MSNTKTKQRKLLTVPRLVILCSLIFALIMGAWFFVRGALVKGLTTSITNLESQNYQIAHNGLSIAGFPFSVHAAMNDVTVRAPMRDMPGPTQNWSVIWDSLRIYSATLTPLSWNIEHRGPMRIDMQGQSGDRDTFDITPATIDGRVAYSLTGLAGTLKSAHIDVGRAQFDSLAGTPPVISQFERLGADIKISDNIGHVSISAADIRLSPKISGIMDNVLGRKLALVEMNANVDNWRLLEVEGGAAWSAANGSIKSEHWAVRWGHVDVVGDFDISFKNGLPEGIIHMRFKRPEPLLQKLIDNKLIPFEYAGAAKTLVALQKPNADGRKFVEITIKDGVVKTGFIPIYKF